jgi:radical SAM enzyme (TIGR01210 family)
VTPYPTSGAARDDFVIGRRPSRLVRDPWQLQGVVVENELGAGGLIERTGTVFLTGRECPWRCVMCDLWQHTIEGDTPPGALPAQIAAARQRLQMESPPITVIKLYNAGSFFDPRAVPEGDYDAIAHGVEGFSRVVVESHPALIGERVDRFLDALDAHRRPAGMRAHLEVAMGLETAHPRALERLHKRMTMDDFVSAADRLTRRGVAVRAFLLIAPPFIPREEQERWLLRSIALAFDCGASVVSLIPTRGGNGALEALSADGLFEPPTLDEVERSVDAAHLWRQAHVSARESGVRIFVDLWDLERLATCPACFDARRDRLHTMNLEQRVLPRAVCSRHRSGTAP